eukprot:Rhum_TRINITY_DN15065_c13_g1::Rhum_TRINITY_DN15065_c13_g1_i1::g.137476::m.137476
MVATNNVSSFYWVTRLCCCCFFLRETTCVTNTGRTFFCCRRCKKGRRKNVAQRHKKSRCKVLEHVREKGSKEISPFLRNSRRGHLAHVCHDGIGDHVALGGAGLRAAVGVVHHVRQDVGHTRNVVVQLHLSVADVGAFVQIGVNSHDSLAKLDNMRVVLEAEQLLALLVAPLRHVVPRQVLVELLQDLPRSRLVQVDEELQLLRTKVQVLQRRLAAQLVLLAGVRVAAALRRRRCRRRRRHRFLHGIHLFCHLLGLLLDVCVELVDLLFEGAHPLADHLRRHGLLLLQSLLGQRDALLQHLVVQDVLHHVAVAEHLALLLQALPKLHVCGGGRSGAMKYRYCS